MEISLNCLPVWWLSIMNPQVISLISSVRCMQGLAARVKILPSLFLSALEVVQIKWNPRGVLLGNTNVLAAASNLNSNPMDLSGIYTVKIVIRFSLGQSIFMGMEISLQPTRCFLVSPLRRCAYLFRQVTVCAVDIVITASVVWKERMDEIYYVFVVWFLCHEDSKMAVECLFYGDFFLVCSWIIETPKNYCWGTQMPSQVLVRDPEAVGVLKSAAVLQPWTSAFNRKQRGPFFVLS